MRPRRGRASRSGSRGPGAAELPQRRVSLIRSDELQVMCLQSAASVSVVHTLHCPATFVFHAVLVNPENFIYTLLNV